MATTDAVITPHTIGVRNRARAYGLVWWVAQLVSLFAFGVFVTIYAINVMPMPWEVNVLA